MTTGILGQKVGMTQIFTEDGAQVPVTVVKISPNFVLQKRSLERDGYVALQLGAFPKKRTNKCLVGHAKKAETQAMAFVKEVRTDKIDGIDLGDQISMETFAVGDWVDVTAKSIGKGFQGVVKRHGFSGGPGGHGSMFHRAPGSIGSRAGGKACRKKVRRGKKLPGHAGDAVVKVQNLRVVDMDVDNGLISLRGAIPGGGRNFLVIESSLKKPRLDSDWKVIKRKAGAASKDENTTDNTK